MTRKFVFKNLQQGGYFSTFNEEHSHIFKDFKSLGMVGGPSIFFTRYHESGITKNRGGTETYRKYLAMIVIQCN